MRHKSKETLCPEEYHCGYLLWRKQQPDPTMKILEGEHCDIPKHLCARVNPLIKLIQVEAYGAQTNEEMVTAFPSFRDSDGRERRLQGGDNHDPSW